MQRLMISLSVTTALVLCGSAFWVAQATPLASSIGTPSQHCSPIEKIGCQQAGDTCPYGKRIVRHSGHGPTCEPCESKKDESSEAPPKGKSSSQKEESSGGRHPSGSSHYDQGHGDYDREDEGYAHSDQGYDRRHERYERDEGYAHGHQGRDEGYDPRDEGYSHGDDGYDQQDYGRGDEGYDRREQGYDRRDEGYSDRAMGLHVSGTMAKDHLPGGALKTSVPMGGKSAAACNSVRNGTVAPEKNPRLSYGGVTRPS